MLSKRVQPHIESVVVSDIVLRTYFWFEDAEESLNDRRLSGTCPANDTYLMILANLKGEVLEH